MSIVFAFAAVAEAAVVAVAAGDGFIAANATNMQGKYNNAMRGQ